MPERRLLCRVRAVDDGGRVRDVARFTDEGRPDRPDMATVGRLARLLLGVVRDGERPVLTDVAPRLRELLDLAGLGELVGETER